ncbi:LPXTG cell wall anchor domain-containing protein [Lactobacillus xujianguonis]|nr:LPXTG cell wall anchor domain-containing protein [Lactobacillus xujianguonis]
MTVTGHAQRDKVTNKLSNYTWNKGNFNEVKTPVVNGYHVTGVTTAGKIFYIVNQKSGDVAETAVTHEDGNTIVTVHFAKNATPAPKPEQPVTPPDAKFLYQNEAPAPKPEQPVTPPSDPTPETPTTPADPTTPVEEDNVTPHPETPETPDEPTSASEPEDEETVAPHDQAEPDDPDKPVKQVKTPVIEENFKPKANQIVKTTLKEKLANPAPQLPQTGESDNDTLALTGLAIANSLALVGLAGMKKRHN